MSYYENQSLTEYRELCRQRREEAAADEKPYDGPTYTPEEYANRIREAAARGCLWAIENPYTFTPRELEEYHEYLRRYEEDMAIDQNYQPEGNEYEDAQSL